MQNLPSPAEREIRSRCGERSFNLGREYFQDGAIIDAKVEGRTLKARCRGSQGGPYRVWVKLGDKGIESADCSCPVGDGGCCKHTAALLLTWLRRPEQFTEAQTIDANLNGRGKDELIALIKQMLRRNPELESLLSMPLPGTGPRKGEAKPAVFKKQAQAAFDEMGDEWGALHDVIGQLEAITEVGEAFLKQKDAEGAAAVYEGVCAAILDTYEDVEDHDGDLASIVQACVKQLNKCLTQISDTKIRKRILRSLFDVYEVDVDLGGISLSDDAVEVLDKLEGEERDQLVKWLKDALKDTGDSGWRNESVAGWLLELQKEELGDEAYLMFCRTNGLRHDLIERLLKLGRGQEALAEAARLGDYELLQLEAEFRRNGQAESFDATVLERARKSSHPEMTEWLRKRARQRGDDAALLELERKEFSTSASKERFEQIRELATKLGKWDAVRAELLKHLKNHNRTDLLVRIGLDEGRLDDALKLVSGRDYYEQQELDLEVAKAAERVRPKAAITIYSRRIEQQINSRGREGYREAARLLKRLRRVHENAGEPDAFSKYMDVLRQKHPKLRTFWDEVDAAGVLSDSGAV